MRHLTRLEADEARAILTTGDKLAAQKYILACMTEPREIHRFVRYVDGRFLLTVQYDNDTSSTRPLTLGERILWRLAARTPRRRT